MLKNSQSFPIESQPFFVNKLNVNIRGWYFSIDWDMDSLNCIKLHNLCD